MSRGYDAKSLYPETLAIAAGASVKIVVMPNQIAVQLKCPTTPTGSLLITNALDSNGSSASIATSYLMDAGEIISFDSTGAFYLSAVGSTATAYCIRVRTSGVAPTDN